MKSIKIPEGTIKSKFLNHSKITQSLLKTIGLYQQFPEIYEIDDEFRFELFFNELSCDEKSKILLINLLETQTQNVDLTSEVERLRNDVNSLLRVINISKRLDDTY